MVRSYIERAKGCLINFCKKKRAFLLLLSLRLKIWRTKVLWCSVKKQIRTYNVPLGDFSYVFQVSVFSRLSLRILITAGREELSNHIRNPKSQTSSSSSSTSPSTSSSTSTSLTTAEGSLSSYLNSGLVNYESIVSLEAHWFNHSHEELIQYAVVRRWNNVVFFLACHIIVVEQFEHLTGDCKGHGFEPWKDTIVL